MQRISCDCQDCRDACKHKPGWLRYGDEQKIAAKLQISVRKLFNDFLIIEYMHREDHTYYFILSPCPVHLPPGSLMPIFESIGRCIFLTSDEKCRIHEVSPLECQLSIHSMTEDEGRKNHFDIAKTWDNEEAQLLIRDLYGSIPVVERPDIFQVLSFETQHALRELRFAKR
jgi:Fe-S-cluster containining protein